MPDKRKRDKQEKSKDKHAGGRPTKYTEDILKQVENYAAVGLPKEDIDFLLGIVKGTRREWEKKYPEFSDAIKRGQLEAEISVTKAMFDSAIRGNTGAGVFFLCNRAPDRWKNIQRIDIGGLGANITDMAAKLNQVFQSDKQTQLYNEKKKADATEPKPAEAKV